MEFLQQNLNELREHFDKSAEECVRAKMLCRSFNELTEDDKFQSPVLNNYSFVKARKSQRILRLKQVRQQTSEVFSLLFPKEPSWFERFKPYLPLLHKNK